MITVSTLLNSITTIRDKLTTLSLLQTNVYDNWNTYKTNVNHQLKSNQTQQFFDTLPNVSNRKPKICSNCEIQQDLLKHIVVCTHVNHSKTKLQLLGIFEFFLLYVFPVLLASIVLVFGHHLYMVFADTYRNGLIDKLNLGVV